MLKIKPFTSEYQEAVTAVCLAPEQIQFAGSAEDFLANNDENLHRHIIEVEGHVVGFFNIDITYATHFSFCLPNTLGLRGFVVSMDQQGKGIGTGAVRALLSYLSVHYSTYDGIYLTVNCRNIGAKRCYLNGGFEDTGEQYLGGAAGPQHIMYRPF